MATGTSYWDMHEPFRWRNNLYELYDSTLNKMKFDSVKSCLAIGAGDGLFEITFIKKCTPNVSKFIAVEPDHESAERLKVRVRERLPGVEGTVIENDVTKWKDPDNQVDLVLLFHVVYGILYGGPDGRRALLKRAHDCWVTDGGFLAVLMSGPRRIKSPGSAYEIFERLGTPLEPMEEVEEDILDAGFIKQHAYEMQHVQYFSSPSENYLKLYQCHVVQPVTLDDVRRVMKELYPDEKGENFSKLVVYKKAN